MTSLIACLGSGKGTWQHLNKVIEEKDWENIYILTDDFGVKNFQPKKPVDYIIIDHDLYLEPLTKDIQEKLKDKIKDFEIGLNMISGTGKEHMAIISALTKLGLGIRLVALTPKGVKEI